MKIVIGPEWKNMIFWKGSIACDLDKSQLKIIPPDTQLEDLFFLLFLKGEILDVMQGHIKSRARW
jgi:hypothetical protein